MKCKRSQGTKVNWEGACDLQYILEYHFCLERPLLPLLDLWTQAYINLQFPNHLCMVPPTISLYLESLPSSFYKVGSSVFEI